MIKTRQMLTKRHSNRMLMIKQKKSKTRLPAQQKTLNSSRKRSLQSRLILRRRKKRPRRKMPSRASPKSLRTRSLRSRKNLLRPNRATSITLLRRKERKHRNSSRSRLRTASRRRR